jgi:hypothetical protein
LAGDTRIQRQLKAKCKDVAHSIEVDDRADVAVTARLVFVIGGVNEDLQIAEELELVHMERRVGTDDVFFELLILQI